VIGVGLLIRTRIAVVCSALTAVAIAVAAEPITLPDLIQKDQFERTTGFAAPIQVRRVELRPMDGWDGTFEDRWNASDAFLRDFRVEFAEGLKTYLQARGFVVSDSPDAIEARVTFERFEGTRRSNKNGATLGGTLTLVRNGSTLDAKPFFESLTYKEPDAEQKGFQRQFGLKTKPHFAMVLFYRLATSAYGSIVDGLMDYRATQPR
jgi:hypothetical protein